MGATRLEATREVVQRASRMALTPLLNTMNVVGIVSIPGMMTGQILGGSDPATAARYQVGGGKGERSWAGRGGAAGMGREGNAGNGELGG